MTNLHDEDLQEEMQVIDIKEDRSSENRSGAAVPDIQALLKGGFITVNPKTGLPDTPQNSVKKKLIRVHKSNGIVEERVELEYYGHVMDPNNPGWRVGLNAEMYYGYLEMERDAILKGRPDNIAPILSESEFESFKVWVLDNKGINIEEENVAIPEIVTEVKARKAAASKKKIESGESTLKPVAKSKSKVKTKVSEPLEEVEEVEEVETKSTDDDLSDL